MPREEFVDLCERFYHITILSLHSLHYDQCNKLVLAGVVRA